MLELPNCVFGRSSGRAAEIGSWSAQALRDGGGIVGAAKYMLWRWGARISLCVHNGLLAKFRSTDMWQSVPEIEDLSRPLTLPCHPVVHLSSTVRCEM